MSNGAVREQGFTRRALFLGGAMGVVGVTLAARMAYLSIFEGEQYRLASEERSEERRVGKEC